MKLRTNTQYIIKGAIDDDDESTLWYMPTNLVATQQYHCRNWYTSAKEQMFAPKQTRNTQNEYQSIKDNFIKTGIEQFK